MKKNSIILIWLVLFAGYHESCLAQGFSSDKTALANFIKRMYTNMPFEGVKIIDDYDHQYLISVITLEKAKYSAESTMNRVAQVKAQSQANTFVNGATISMEFIISTKETVDSNSTINSTMESMELIKESSIGFTQGLEILTNFDDIENRKRTYIYMRELPHR
ncbi:MAG: hypothetical protein ACEQSL_06750 [Sediminibacterium sp.]|jgi:hypothetical protein